MQLPLLAGADRAQPALEKLRTAIREERECRVVLRNYRSDGALFWNELYIAPVFDEEGRLRKFVGVQNYVTEIKRAEEVLAESENRLRLAVKSTGLGIWDFDPLTRRSKWDEWCKELFGLPPETEVDYYIFLSRLHPDNSERTDRIVQRARPRERGRVQRRVQNVGA